ncbi:hypothetical protein TUSAK1_46870 [Klebsiella variicola]
MHSKAFTLLDPVAFAIGLLPAGFIQKTAGFLQIKPPLAGNGRIVIQRSGSKNIVGRFQDAKERGFNGSSAIDGALEGCRTFRSLKIPVSLFK